MTELTRAEELAIIEPIVGSTEVAERVIDALSMSQPKYRGASEPGAWLSRDLLLRAVDLRAIAWNALCAVPAAGGSWDRFWRKLHNLREAVNRPEHEDIRIAYAGTFEPQGDEGHGPAAEAAALREAWAFAEQLSLSLRLAAASQGDSLRDAAEKVTARDACDHPGESHYRACLDCEEVEGPCALATPDRLREALPAVVNFRFLPPRPVHDPVWSEIAEDLARRLAALDAEEERHG